MPSPEELLVALKDYASGIIKGNTADTLGAPVDLINAAISPFTKAAGIYSDDPLGGSKTFRALLQQGIEDKNIAETAGSMLSVGGAAKAMIVGAARLGKLSSTETKLTQSAEELLKEGVKNPALYNSTGRYIDKDKVLKGAISDSSATLAKNFEEKLKSGAGLKDALPRVNTILEHPELYILYPDLKNISIRTEGPPGSGSYSKYANVITIGASPGDPEKYKSTLLHELQHAAQSLDGTNGGDNMLNHLPFTPAIVQKRLDAAKASPDASIRDAVDRFKTIANMKIREAGNRYLNNPGEQEARFTQQAMNLDTQGLANKILEVLKRSDTPQSYDTKPIRPILPSK